MDDGTFAEQLTLGADVYFACQTIANSSSLLKAYASYALNQVILPAQKRILRNNQAKAVLLSENRLLMPEEEDRFRDQGFTRPRVLVLAPFRNQARDLVRHFAEMWTEHGKQVDGMKRFEEEFNGDDESANQSQKGKGEEFGWQFRGNIDDCYRVGIKCTRKTMKLFSEFYSSDIIVASPLGLRLVIDGTERRKEGDAKKRQKKAGDADFLSSIRLVVVDQADIMSMQNWEHLETVMGHLNGVPKMSHDCDFSRVQQTFLDSRAKEARQTVVLSAFEIPELNALWKKYSTQAKRRKYEQAADGHAYLLAKMTATPALETFASSSLVDLPQARFDHFVRKTFPKFSRLAGVCIFVSSYFEFVQLRSHLEQAETSFAMLSEYTSTPDISRARARFFNGHAKILLVTERFHFFRRYNIRGIQHLLFYSLPAYPHYFAEWIGMLSAADEKYIVPVVVEPRFDQLKLVRIFDPERTKKLGTQ